MPCGVTRSPLGIAAPSPWTSSTNCALVLVLANTHLSGLPATHHVALSAINTRAASTLPAEKFSKKPRTTCVFASALITPLLCVPRCTACGAEAPLDGTSTYAASHDN